MAEVNLYFGLLLLLAALAIGGLAMVTGMQVFRLRNKRLSWRTGTLYGFPLFSTLFLGVSLLLFGILISIGGRDEVAASLLYLMIACSWFVSSYFSSTHYITDNGIVKNVNDPAQTVAWHQIHDFFEQKKGNLRSYTFIYRPKNEETITNAVRLQLDVPEEKHQAFKNLLSHKLGRRISCYEEELIDISHFEI